MAGRANLPTYSLPDYSAYEPGNAAVVGMVGGKSRKTGGGDAAALDADFRRQLTQVRSHTLTHAHTHTLTHTSSTHHVLDRRCTHLNLKFRA